MFVLFRSPCFSASSTFLLFLLLCSHVVFVSLRFCQQDHFLFKVGCRFQVSSVYSSSAEVVFVRLCVCDGDNKMKQKNNTRK